MEPKAAGGANRNSATSIVFCDSLDALEQARASGLPPSVEIRTSSPALLLSGNPNVKSMDAPPERLNDYWNAAGALSESLFRASFGFDGDHDRAVIVARTALAMHRKLTSSLTLEDADFTEPRLVLKPRTSNPQENIDYEPLWSVLLRENPHCDIREIHLPSKAVKETPPSLLVRSRFAGWAEFGYSLGIKLWRKRHTGKQPVILVERVSESVRETAFSLMLKGAKVVELDQTVMPATIANEALPAPVSAAFQDFLSEWFAPQVGRAALKNFAETLGQALGRFEAAKVYWKNRLPDLVPGGRGVILVAFPGKPEVIALGAAGRERGIPLVAFQHGVTRELNAAHKETYCTFENAVSDILFTYNDEAKAISSQIPYARGRVETVGLPNAYGRMNRRFFFGKAKPILYVSTTLLSGNVNFYVGSHSDVGRVEQEVNLVEGVFDALPHEVTVKLYPAPPRYAEPDLVAQCVARCGNVQRLESEIDLRYLVSRYRVLVTSRASSTLSWCLMSGKPLVFINHPDHAPLRDEVRELLSKALFLFDWGTPGMMADLREFLSRPIDVIEAEWAEKSAAREDFLRRYIKGPGVGAGRRAAAVLQEVILEQHRDQ